MEREDGVITLFMSNYQRQRDYYYAAARLASSQCEEALERSGIRAITTFRVKRSDHLQAKLLRRRSQRREDGRGEYKDDQSIRDDIPDLAGVRMALYFPDDCEQVGKLLEETFRVENKERMRSKKYTRPGFHQRVDGYTADHYRVRLKPSALRPEQHRYSEAVIEIQVASLLMFSWFEVSHELTCKPGNGQASKDELGMLDALNGLVIAGELILKQLQARASSRKSTEGPQAHKRI